MDWFDLLAVQGTLKSLLHYHNLKASVLWHSAFFMVHLSHPYMTTEETIVLTIWTFFGKVISLFFNTLSRFVIVFLLGSKRLNFMARFCTENKKRCELILKYLSPQNLAT